MKILYHSRKHKIANVRYGLLYNEAAFKNSKNIAGAGWRIPTIEDFQALSDYLGGTEQYGGGMTVNPIAGGKLKDTAWWDSPNTGAANEVGFNGRAAGLRTNLSGGLFDFIGTMMYLRAKGVSYWNGSTLYSFVFVLRHNAESAQIPHSNDSGTLNANWGIPIRLIKGSSNLSHGQTSTYHGNDDKIYTTICIGSQEWTAENLVETKYQDGTAIPEVTDGTTWATLETGAFCAYNNYWVNV